jgi:hypothetical protein
LIYFTDRKEFFFEIKGPLISFLLFGCFDIVDNLGSKLNLKFLYQIALIKNKNKIIDRSIVKTLLGSIKSYNIL